MVFSLLKLSSITTLALAFTIGVHADKCSSSDYDQTTSAANLVFAEPSCTNIAYDLATGNATEAQLCGTPCKDFVENMVSLFPDCEDTFGVNVQMALKDLLLACSTDTRTTDTTTDVSSSPASTAGYFSIVSVAVVVAAFTFGV